MKNENYIFMSYAHRDTDRVTPIISRLQRDGFRVWYDEGIDPGTEWADNIANKIEKSCCFLALISKQYLESENCRDELSYARENGVKILLLYLEDVELPSGIRLRNHRRQQLFYYKYGDKNDFFERLYLVEEFAACKTDGSYLPEQADAEEPPVCMTEECEFPPADVKQLENFSNGGDMESTYTLARFYECGILVVEDKVKAFQLYQLAREQGSVEAKVALGRFYKYGVAGHRDKKKAFQYFEDAAFADSAAGIEYLAYEYEDGKTVAKDSARALGLLERSYELGNPNVAERIGDYYFEGIPGVLASDKKKAAQWYQRALEEGTATFCADTLANMYLQGDGVLQSVREAERALQFEEEADLFGTTHYEIGMRYFSGDGVPQDKGKGISYLKKAAEEMHLPDAAAELGRIYREGDGVSRDPAASKYWYRMAADSDSLFPGPGVLLKSGRGRLRLAKGCAGFAAAILAGAVASSWLNRLFLSSASSFAVFLLSVVCMAAGGFLAVLSEKTEIFDYLSSFLLFCVMALFQFEDNMNYLLIELLLYILIGIVWYRYRRKKAEMDELLMSVYMYGLCGMFLAFHSLNLLFYFFVSEELSTFLAMAVQGIVGAGFALQKKSLWHYMGLCFLGSDVIILATVVLHMLC